MLEERTAVGGPVGAVLRPCLRLLHLRANEQGQQCGYPADEEHHAPAIAWIVRVEIWIDRAESDRREEVAEGVAFLEQARQQPAQPGRGRLERQRRANAPLAAHADPEQETEDDERLIARRKAGEHRYRRVEDHIQHQRQPPPIAVCEHAKDDRADGTHHERKRERKGNVGARSAKRSRDVVDDEREHEEVECVEGPSEKARQHGIPLVDPAGLRHGGGLQHDQARERSATWDAGLPTFERRGASARCAAPEARKPTNQA